MYEFVSSRTRRRAVVAAVVAAVLVAGALLARPRLEEVLRARLEKEAARRGAEASIGAVRLGLWPPVRLRDVAVSKSGLRFEAKQVDCFWRGRTRLNVFEAALHGPADLSLASELTAWDLRGAGGSWSLALVKPRPGLLVERTVAPGENDLALRLSDLPVDRVFDVRRGDRALLQGGTLRGSARLTDAAGVLAFDVDLTSSAARLPALAAEGDLDPGLGAPTQVELRAAGTWRRPEKTLDVPAFSAAIAGAAVSGSLAVHDLGADPTVDLSLEVERADFATLLQATGVGAPAALEADARTTTAAADLGAASLSAHAQGRLSDPASFVVTQDVRFTPPARVPAVIARLRGDFVHEAVVENGDSHVVEVARASPDYIPLDEVPPLFLRTLLLAEDAGFYGHPGIDLRELPSAILTDWARGGAVRGASTITQQLAKNLFLTRDKRVGRKVQEVPLAFLLESSLGKKRILEIYVNVIEWGPGLFGLRPAARAYFGREPRELTPAQMAFLVCLIPAPVKYQSSFAHGTPGPGLRQLVDALLAKLRSVDALSEDDYRAALGETIIVRGADTPAPVTPAENPAPAAPTESHAPAPPAEAPPSSPPAVPADPPAAPAAGG
ncbi:MAG TPA: biosynthetic peptidoglycan transglycosylase [Verrucomicrobiae bacterium]|nr:biosynthetic peptidoglycan transglycosylase [Verrucomicrobiae bacterium]